MTLIDWIAAFVIFGAWCWFMGRGAVSWADVIQGSAKGDNGTEF